MNKFSAVFKSLLILTVLGNTSVKAQTNNAAPYCQYNSNMTVKGFSGAISKVTLGTLSNSSAFGNLPTAYNSTSGTCSQLYTYYNNVAAPQLTTGSNNTISLEFKSWFDGEPLWYAAYIDFNHNNVFDTTSEMIIDMAHANVLGFIPSSNTNAIITTTRSNTFTVPTNAVTGTTRMRVIRSHRDYLWRDSVSRVNPCMGFPFVNTSTNNWNFGEVEDYDVTIVAASTGIPAFVSLASNTVTTTGATLSGVVNANGATAAVSFEYGTTIAYGNTLTATPASVTGSTNTNIASTATGLAPNTVYHYRIKAIVGANNYYSVDSTFKTQGTTGVADINAENGLKIYPNPSKGQINIEMPGTNNEVTINIFNMAGANVFSGKERINGTKTINLDVLPDGLYEVQILAGDKKYRQNISIVH
jgi:hypothetical protein